MSPLRVLFWFLFCLLTKQDILDLNVCMSLSTSYIKDTLKLSVDKLKEVCECDI